MSSPPATRFILDAKTVVMKRAMAVAEPVEFARASLGNKEPAFGNERLFINFKNGGFSYV